MAPDHEVGEVEVSRTLERERAEVGKKIARLTTAIESGGMDELDYERLLEGARQSREREKGLVRPGGN